MKLHIISVGKNVPTWASCAYTEYQNRLPKNFSLTLHSISSPGKRVPSNVQKITEQEGIKILSSIPKKSKIITLDMRGQLITTRELSNNLRIWQLNSQDISFLVGGPDGLSKSCLSQADFSWSLSPLTLPHAMVRMIVAEQLYRAWSILNNHPYHRGE